MKCNDDREFIKKHLLDCLKRLHLLSESTIDMLESAVFEGGIVEVEMLWKDLLNEDPPDKIEVLGRKRDRLD